MVISVLHAFALIFFFPCVFTLIVTVPVANKRDTRSIEEAMNEIRAKKRQKKGEEEGSGSGSGV